MEAVVVIIFAAASIKQGKDLRGTWAVSSKDFDHWDGESKRECSSTFPASLTLAL